MVSPDTPTPSPYSCARLSEGLLNVLCLLHLQQGSSCAEERRAENPNTFHLGHGVDYRHFALSQIPGLAVPDDLRIIARPIIGYMGSAWATLVCYASMMGISYFMGNKHYPVNYDLKRILGYLTLSLLLYFTSGMISDLLSSSSSLMILIINNFWVFLFVVIVYFSEKRNIFKISANQNNQ